ncbi:PAS/PAC sensor signal transduction histidine kinase [Lutibacter oricola]|uniref:histidine kinase n=1 Tax=Lutibacter oricola TaxID=762486 RepID=A0A1H3AFV6_9FLAO|nr:PAS domain-containing sensor histidine kinase [Lutibacter oricola]SDX28503.1 PAS/PAC sensor signal transduction histidine kinase [Lutibacter oricola]
METSYTTSNFEKEKLEHKKTKELLEQKTKEFIKVTSKLKSSNLKLQELLHQKTSELEGVFSNIVDAYIMMDLSGNVIKMNNAAVEMLEYDINKAPFNLLKIVKEEYVEYTNKAFDELRTIGFYKNFQAFIKTKNNKEKLVHVNSSLIYNDEGVPFAAQGIIRDITKEHNDKDLIEEQKEQLDIIVNHSSIGIALSRIDGKGLLLANKYLCEVSGYTPEEFKNVILQDIMHKDDVKESNRLKEKLYKGIIDSYNLDRRFIKKNGEIVWTKTSVTAVKSNNGYVKYHVTTIEDITKEKEANLKLIEYQNRLKTLVRNLKSGILLEDEFGKIKIVNKKFCDMFNTTVKPCNLIDRDVSVFNDNAKLAFVNVDQFERKNAWKIERDEQLYKEELELVDGRMFERNGTPIIQDGEYRGYLWSYYDTTLNKRFKDSLEAQKEKYSRIIANMNLGLLEVDNNDAILFANQRFSEISGYSRSELIGLNASDLFLLEENKDSFIKRNKLRNQGISDSYEVRVKTKSGEIRHWLISGAPNYNDDNELIGSIGIHSDITEQKKLESQKEQLVINLENQNQKLNDYAHVVSHDLKSPLRGISALLSWTKEDFEDKLGEESLFNLNLMEDKVEKMDKLIGDILNYSSIENEVINVEPVDVNQVIDRIVSTIFIPDHIKVKVTPKLPIIDADFTRLQQLFQNIMSNAINYIDKDKGLVEVNYKNDNEYHVFSIKDNGPGIPEEYHTKIFKMFKTVGDHDQSTGIGLSIVKKIIQLYKGKVWLESVIGEGTTFYFSLKK